MIYIVEFPHDARPRAWFAFDREDFIRKVHASKGDPAHTIFQTGTPRFWLEEAEQSPDSDSGQTETAWIRELGERFGWDTPLYRADHLLEPGQFQTTPVTEFDACVASLGHDLHACRLYLSDGSATAALYGDPIYDVRQGFHAHMALREQLIAMEVIADDL